MAQRARKRAKQLDAAKRVAVPTHTDVCVVGGGAAGLVAAISAAEKGARVVVLERSVECGRTILATGNGRCNFANANLDSCAYNDPGFVHDVCGSQWLEHILGFFADCGLAWEEEDGGRLYPLSRQAASVRNVLLARAHHAGVLLATGRETLSVFPNGMQLGVRYKEEWSGSQKLIDASSVVLAAGGNASLAIEPKLPVCDATPILCPLSCTGPYLRELNGRRVRAEVRLIKNGQVAKAEGGEVLFRSYGLSGIVIFNMSRHALPGDTLSLDLLPSLSVPVAEALTHSTLDGILDPVVASCLASGGATPRSAIEHVKGLTYAVTGPAEADRAQVTRGGLATSAFDTSTLEAHASPGLYACGEALNVDGPCGGYNLAWAWKSGLVAGRSAAERSIS